MEDHKDEEARKNKEKNHPFATSNIFSRIFFTWMFPLFYKGLKKTLVEDDLYTHLQSHESTYLGTKLEKAWYKELRQKPKNPSLWNALRKVFGKQFFWLGVYYFFVRLFIKIAQPIFLSQFLEYYKPDSKMTKTEAYYYAAGICISALLSSGCMHTFLLHSQHLGLKIRVATSSLVYRKTLKLSKSAFEKTTVGQMVNLISNDVARFETITTNLHSLWLAPLDTIVLSILLYVYVGPSGIVGVFLLLSIVPFQMWMGKKTSDFRLAAALRTDERIHLMNEIASGIQVIKMYTWEKLFAKLVELSRLREMDSIRKILVIRAILMSFNLFLNRTAVYLCIITYVLTGSILNAQYVYVIQSFYGILRTSVTVNFPQAITQIAECNITIKRIWKFLMHEEVNSSQILLDGNQAEGNPKPNFNELFKVNGLPSIYITNASVKWLKTSSENTLKNLNIEIRSNELAAVIGPVGSGKSTLLHAILGELCPVSGKINVKGRISYCSQEPWLFVGSVRQNILFGQKFHAKKYEEVIKVCQLQQNITLFPYGDRTIVGERGVFLSGGQRARINLARAVYKEADIYLVDDPLSPVDADVGKQLFEECILGYLKNKCVIVVTHLFQYLKNVGKIYVINEGKIDCFGTYDEVQASRGKFTQLFNELKNIDAGNNTGKELNGKNDNGTEATNLRRPLIEEVISKHTKRPQLENEGKKEGIVSYAVYKSYFVPGRYWWRALILFISLTIIQAFASFADYFLNWWVNMNQIATTADKLLPNNSKYTNLLTPSKNSRVEAKTFNNTLVVSSSTSYIELTTFQKFWFTYMNQDVVLISYSVIIIVVITLTIDRFLAFFRFCNKTSIRLHNSMFHNIVYATIRFFNVNPSGRILNRFSKDMNQVDEALPLILLDTFQILLIIIAVITVTATVNPWILLPALLMLTIFYLLRMVFLSTSRDIKRLEGIRRSPIYSHLTASLQGLTTIRAFRAENILKQEFDNYQNAYSSAYFMSVSANRTFGFWLDMHCAAFITFVTMSFLVFDSETFGGNVGLSVTQALNLMSLFQLGMRQWSDLENTMTCVERIKEYADIVPEQDINTKDPPKSWPEKGYISFENLNLSYAVGETYVLKNINFCIKGSEKVGIVGRTGAGKSSIIMALFRLAILEGRITIDNVDTQKISLNKLRSSISIIPQEPVLFSGTLRNNLDPLDKHTDKVLWTALEDVELKSAVCNIPCGLQNKMSAGGSNFSVGQRQLICLARAILSKNKILVLDEATANVDPHTDALIQTSIRKKFSNCTVITIAHRLNTVMNSDKVLVMDSGRAIQFGHPYELLQNNTGCFYELVQQAGRATAENLHSIAKQSYKIKAQLETEKSN